MRYVSPSTSQLRASPQLRECLSLALCAALIVSTGCSKEAPTDPASSEMPDSSLGSSAGSVVAKSAADGGVSGRVSSTDAGTDAAPSAGGSSQSSAGQGSRVATESAGSGAADGTDAGAAKELPIDFSSTELAGDLAQAVCSALRTCLGEQKLAAFVGREPCEARFRANLAQQDFASLEDAAKRGRVRVARESLEQCYSDTRALGCAIQTERLPASCQRAIAGQAEVGEPCSIGADCAGDAFCPSTACPRVCTRRMNAAESCKRDEECVNGLICLSERCAKAAAVGETCAGSSGAVCALGASCLGSTKTEAGSCARNSEIQVGALGEACTPGGTLCREGLSCAYDGDSAFSCQAAVASGGACHLALPGQCPTDEYCSAQDVMTEGSCEPLPVQGAACVLGGECAGGHICLAGSNGKGLCWKFRDLSEACTQDAQCRSGRCAQGHCAAPVTCD